MDCGVPFCNTACPLGNLIPDWNDLVRRDDWKARDRAAARDQQLPRVHRPDLPGAVRVGLRARHRRRPGDDQADRVRDRPPRLRGGLDRPPAARAAHRQTVAVVGSGPAGLAAAAELNQVGHAVTVYERDEAPGGLMRFGVPDAKLEKWMIDRRVELLEAEGIEFVYDVEVGGDVDADELARRPRRGRDRDRLAGRARLRGPRPRARRGPLRDGLPLPAQPLGRPRPGPPGAASPSRAPRSPPRASTSS